MTDPLHVRSERDGASVRVVSDEFEITTWLEEGAEGTEGTTDAHALWMAMPIAMRLGRPLVVDGQVCAMLVGNARRLGTIWSFWRPDLYSEVEVAATDPLPPENGPTGQGRLMTYSGGLDSTYSLSRFVDETGEKPIVLSVLGMDYRRSDRDRFDRLLARTRPFRDAYASGQIVLRSDAASVMRRFGVPADVGFSFQLLSSMFLFERRFEAGMIAADFAHFQECIVGGYSTSAALEPFWRSAGFGVDLLGLEATRVEKAKAVMGNPLALNVMSFCKDYNTRPENCGICSKCLRMKAIFHALSGEIPDIFVKRDFDPADFRGFDFGRVFERVFAQDILRAARQNGREDAFAWMAEGLAGKREVAGLKFKLYKAGIMLRAWRQRQAGGGGDAG